MVSARLALDVFIPRMSHAGRAVERAGAGARSEHRPQLVCQVPCTVTVAVALSSVSLLGTLLAVTVAVSVSVPALVGVTTMVTVAVPPPARFPMLQVTVPSLVLGALLVERVQVPWVADIEPKT